jgi:hypothetical protein
VKGTTIWYIGNNYGHNPPRGIIRETHECDARSWVKVEKNYNTT